MLIPSIKKFVILKSSKTEFGRNLAITTQYWVRCEVMVKRKVLVHCINRNCNMAVTSCHPVHTAQTPPQQQQRQHTHKDTPRESNATQHGDHQVAWSCHQSPGFLASGEAENESQSIWWNSSSVYIISEEVCKRGVWIVMRFGIRGELNTHQITRNV